MQECLKPVLYDIYWLLNIKDKNNQLELSCILKVYS